MAFHWSNHAPHIQSVFSPWQPQDGYELPLLLAAEQALGIQLPRMLREFYQAWGRRTDLTRTLQTLLTPNQLQLQSGWLIFAEENQAIYSWAIPATTLTLPNPPVYFAEPSTGRDARQWSLSHTHLSDFFDYLTYGHALSCGAPHGGSAQPCSDATRHHIMTHWHSLDIASVPMGLFPDATARWVLYGRPGVVIDCLGPVWIAAQTADIRDTVGEELQLRWDEIW